MFCKNDVDVLNVVIDIYVIIDMLFVVIFISLFF